MSEAVLDASALLAVLQGEFGADRVITRLAEAAISAVNLAEVLSKLVDHGVPAAAACEAVAGLDLKVVAFDGALAQGVAALRASTRAAGLSLGDRACLALAARLGVPAVTADRAWRALRLEGVVVEEIR